VKKLEKNMMDINTSSNYMGLLSQQNLIPSQLDLEDKMFYLCYKRFILLSAIFFTVVLNCYSQTEISIEYLKLKSKKFEDKRITISGFFVLGSESIPLLFESKEDYLNRNYEKSIGIILTNIKPTIKKSGSAKVKYCIGITKISKITHTKITLEGIFYEKKPILGLEFLKGVFVGEIKNFNNIKIKKQSLSHCKSEFGKMDSLLKKNESN
jgi:hypothetical protein